MVYKTIFIVCLVCGVNSPVPLKFVGFGVSKFVNSHRVLPHFKGLDKKEQWRKLDLTILTLSKMAADPIGPNLEANLL